MRPSHFDAGSRTRDEKIEGGGKRPVVHTQKLRREGIQSPEGIERKQFQKAYIKVINKLINSNLDWNES